MKLYYVENGLPYVDEDKLPPCGCGGKAKVDFHFQNGKFRDVEIYCGDCYITTGIRNDIDKAIDVWHNAMAPKNKYSAMSENEPQTIGGLHGD